MTRQLATVKPISELRPIPDADSIETAIIDGGWPTVVRKGQYEVGELVLFLEIDSWVPVGLAPFLFTKNEPKTYQGVKGQRLKTVKLRGQLSQGLALKLEPIDHICYDVVGSVKYDDGTPYVIDITGNLDEQLGILKWEAPENDQLAGNARGNFPHFIPKTDQERVQNLANKLQDHWNETFEVTIKLDGSSMTAYYFEGEFGVCSRNINLQTAKDNTYWKVAIQLRLEEILTKHYEETGQYLALQGELMGPGIQKNREGLTTHEFYVFDVWNISEQRYLTPKERYDLMASEHFYFSDIRHVPVLSQIGFITGCTVDDILAYAEGPSLHNEVREGVVFKSNSSNFTFKAISNNFLIKDSN